MIKKIYFLCFIFITINNYISAQLSLVPFSSGYSNPVDIKNCGDNRLFIVEKNGQIIICDSNGVKNSTPFLNITARVHHGGEAGLLGLAFPGDFKASGYFYVFYNSVPDLDIHISRFHVDSLTPDSADTNSEEMLLTIPHRIPFHNGGQLMFGPDGYLYIGTGDGFTSSNGQNPDSLLGKLLRIAVDPSDSTYAIPPSNPFATNTSLGQPEIWALGLRNPWRWSFDALTGDLWIGDVGAATHEEIDLQPNGSPGGINYGWSCWEADTLYQNLPDCQPYSFYEPPVHNYRHTGGMCSVTGGYVYRGAVSQSMYGKYFYADYCNSQIQYLEPNGSGGYTNTNLDTMGAVNVTAFGVDRHNELYCAAQNNGSIYKFVYSECLPVATINLGKDTIDDCGTLSVNLSVPLDSTSTYLWTFNGDTASTSHTMTATQAGMYYVTVLNYVGCPNSDSVYVEFTAPINLFFTGLDSLYCIYNSLAVLIPSHTPGAFSGDGVIGSTFNPAAAGVGIHTVTYNYSSLGCHSSFSQNTRVDACLGIPEVHIINSMNIYPNPSSEEFYVQWVSSTEKKITLEIMDLTGRKLLVRNLLMNAGENRIPVHHSLSDGIYIITISDGAASSSFKLGVRLNHFER